MSSSGGTPASPEPTGSVGWDTLLASQTGLELRLAGLERPAWTWPEALATWWFVNLPSPILVPATVDVASMVDMNDVDPPELVVDAADDPIAATTGGT